MSLDNAQQSFYWWYANISSIIDSDIKGRVRCRVLNYHSWDTKEIAQKDLPWAHVMLPTTSSAVDGMGENHGLKPGSWVIGFWLDGATAQQPIIIGTWWGDTPKERDGNGGNDTRLANTLKSVVKRNPGDGFQDPGDNLSNRPKNVIKLKSPDGSTSEGNDHGIQFTDQNRTAYPQKEYLKKSALNPLHTNECDKEEELSKKSPTLKKLKKTLRSEGGLLDDGFTIYKTFQKQFFCGVIKSLGGTRKQKYGRGTFTDKGAEIKSTSGKDEKDDKLEYYKPYTETPLSLTDGGIVIYDKNNINGDVKLGEKL